MWTFLIRRLLFVPPLLFIVSLLTYLLMWASPGDYYSKFAEDPTKSKEWIATQRYEAGISDAEGNALNPIQGYAIWLGNAVTGDFGDSLERNRPVLGLIGERFGNTLILSIMALILAWGSAIPLGVIAAVKQGTWIDRGNGLVAYLGLSLPRVFFALLMILFAAKTGWFPVGDMRNVVEWEQLGFFAKCVDVGYHLVLPAFVLGSTAMAGYMRQMRASMLESLSQDYVRTARAKGLGQGAVIGRHALRNAINPLVTLFGFSLAYLINGAFLVEIVMNWPGMARLVVKALFDQDQPVVMASVLVATLALILGNIVADVLLGLTDPRIRNA